jgi:hypothetical protein
MKTAVDGMLGGSMGSYGRFPALDCDPILGRDNER